MNFTKGKNPIFYEWPWISNYPFCTLDNNVSILGLLDAHCPLNSKLESPLVQKLAKRHTDPQREKKGYGATKIILHDYLLKFDFY